MSDDVYTERFFTFYKLFWTFVYVTMMMGIFAIFVLVRVQLMGAEVSIIDPAEILERR